MIGLMLVGALTLGVLIGILLTTLTAKSVDRDLSMDATRYWALSPDRGRQVPIQFAVKRPADQ